MGIIEIFITACGLSMDAFAVSICKGLSMKRFKVIYALAIAIAFGFFQALMPLIGWLLGASFYAYIEPIDHWLAFILLGAIGAKMLWDGIHDDGVCDCEEEGKNTDGSQEKLDLKELLMLAIATSIDALAVGITFAFLGVDIVFAITMIGLTTFVFSFVGVGIGCVFGSRFERGATIFGGIVLIAIGLKILLEHLGLISF